MVISPTDLIRSGETLRLLHELAVRDSRWEIRQAAVQAIAQGWPEDPETLPLLHRGLTDRSKAVQDAARDAIRHIES